MRIETTVGNAGAPTHETRETRELREYSRALCRVERIQPRVSVEARSQPVKAAGSDLPRSPFAPGLAIPVPVQWGAVRR